MQIIPDSENLFQCEKDYKNEVAIGDSDITRVFCGTKLFKEKINIFVLGAENFNYWDCPSDGFSKLIRKNYKRSSHFSPNLRKYNKALAMTPFGDFAFLRKSNREKEGGNQKYLQFKFSIFSF